MELYISTVIYSVFHISCEMINISAAVSSFCLSKLKAMGFTSPSLSLLPKNWFEMLFRSFLENCTIIKSNRNKIDIIKCQRKILIPKLWTWIIIMYQCRFISCNKCATGKGCWYQQRMHAAARKAGKSSLLGGDVLSQISSTDSKVLLVSCHNMML